MHFVNPGLLAGRKDFDERYAQPISRADTGVAKHLRERIRPFILRRLKREVAPELPPRTEQILRCQLSGAEREVYNTVRVATQAKLMERAGAPNVMAALEALLRLRQASCHAGLVPGQSAEGSSKIDLLVDTLTSVVAQGHKALVFSQWTGLLNLIEPYMEGAELDFVRLDGQTRDRQGVVDTFQADDGPPVMLISLKAGGTGLNLTAADHVFLVDPGTEPRGGRPGRGPGPPDWAGQAGDGRPLGRRGHGGGSASPSGAGSSASARARQAAALGPRIRPRAALAMTLVALLA